MVCTCLCTYIATPPSSVGRKDSVSLSVIHMVPSYLFLTRRFSPNRAFFSSSTTQIMICFVLTDFPVLRLLPSVPALSFSVEFAQSCTWRSKKKGRGRKSGLLLRSSSDSALNYRRLTTTTSSSRSRKKRLKGQRTRSSGDRYFGLHTCSLIHMYVYVQMYSVPHRCMYVRMPYLVCTYVCFLCVSVSIYVHIHAYVLNSFIWYTHVSCTLLIHLY